MFVFPNQKKRIKVDVFQHRSNTLVKVCSVWNNRTSIHDSDKYYFAIHQNYVVRIKIWQLSSICGQ